MHLSFCTVLFLTLALNVAKADLVDVYREHESRFSSGQMNRAKLENRVLEKKSRDWVQVRTCESFAETTDSSTLSNCTTGWVPFDLLRNTQELNGWALVQPDKLSLRETPLWNSSTSIKTLNHLDLVEVLKAQSVVWNLSFLSEGRGQHSAVWWVENLPSSVELNGDMFSNQQVLKRKIHDMSSHIHNPNFKVIAAKGVFITTDGMNWKGLRRFGDVNLPVAISDLGTLYVGEMKSMDQGESFEPLIDWQKLLKQLSVKSSSAITKVKVVEIENHPNSMELILSLSSGSSGTSGGSSVRIVRIVSQDDFNTWTIR